MRKRTATQVGWLRVLAATTLVLACVASVETARAQGSAEEGRDLLDRKGCLACHTIDGGPSVGPTLRGIIERRGEEYVRRSILDPAADIAEGYVAGIMPAVPLAEAELDSIVSALKEAIPDDELPRHSSLASVALGASLFVGLHLLFSSGWVRPRLIAAMGEKNFSWLYSLTAIATLSWTWWAWEAAPYVELWPQWSWTRWVPNLGMPFVCILAYAGYTANSPTIAGMEKALESEESLATGVLRISRHPANSAFVVWAILHLFPNGDVASALLFGSVIALGVLGTWHIERRRARTGGEAWARFANETSIVPFAAILRGKQRLDLREIGWMTTAKGLALWIGLILTHIYFAGALPWPVL